MENNAQENTDYERTNLYIRREDRGVLKYLCEQMQMPASELFGSMVDLVHLVKNVLPKRNEFAIIVNMNREKAKKIGRLWEGMPLRDIQPVRERLAKTGDLFALDQFAAKCAYHIVVLSDDPHRDLGYYAATWSWHGVDIKNLTITRDGRETMTFLHPMDNFQRLQEERYEAPNVKIYRHKLCTSKVSRWAQAMLDRDEAELQRAIEQFTPTVTKDIGDYDVHDPDNYVGFVIMKQAHAHRLSRWFLSAQPDLSQRYKYPLQMEVTEEEYDAVMKMRAKQAR